MSWEQERDSLIAQALVLVQSVTGKQEENDNANAGLAQTDEPEMRWPSLAALSQLRPFETVQTIAAPPSAPPPAAPPLQPATTSDFAAEIRARVASFRAVQERLRLRLTASESLPPRRSLILRPLVHRP